MATKKRATTRQSTQRKTAAAVESLEPEGKDPADTFGARTTGRLLCTFMDDSAAGVKSALASFKSQAGVSSVAHARDFKTEFLMAEAETADAVVFDELNIAVITGSPDQMSAMSRLSTAASDNVVIEPEYVNFAFQDGLDGDLSPTPDEGSVSGPGSAPASSLPYLRGYRDALDQMIGVLVAPKPPECSRPRPTAFRTPATRLGASRRPACFRHAPPARASGWQCSTLVST